MSEINNGSLGLYGDGYSKCVIIWWHWATKG